MRRVVVVLALLAMVLPIAAWADGIDIINRYGSVTVSNSGIVSRNSQLKEFNGVKASKGHSLGTVNFSTGALVSGSIASGGVFSDQGSSFTVTGRGKGVPKGVIFSGAFVGDINWVLTGQGNGLTYTLSGNIEGMLYTGHMVTGSTTQTIYSDKGQLSQGIGHIRAGTTHLGGTPEPGTLGLLGTGLLGIAGMFRRKRSV